MTQFNFATMPRPKVHKPMTAHEREARINKLRRWLKTPAASARPRKAGLLMQELSKLVAERLAEKYGKLR